MGEKILLDAVEMANLLGISRQSVFVWSGEGQLPAPVKIGRLRRWHKPTVEKFLADKAQEVAHGA